MLKAVLLNHYKIFHRKVQLTFIYVVVSSGKCPTLEKVTYIMDFRAQRAKVQINAKEIISMHGYLRGINIQIRQNDS